MTSRSIISPTLRAMHTFAFVQLGYYVNIHARAHSPLLFTSSTGKHVASSLAVSLLSSPYLPNVDSYVIDTSVRAQRLLPGKKSPRLVRLCSRAKLCGLRCAQ